MADETRPGRYVDDDRLESCTVGPDVSILGALSAIDSGGIGVCLICTGDRRFVGILSDGDVRRAILAGASLESPAVEHLGSAPLWALPNELRDNVLDSMQARRVDVVPIVTDDGVLVGAHTLQELIGTEPLPNLAVIMAGGKGTRLGSITETIPKPMLDVAGRPILDRIVQKLVGHGIRELAISVNFLADLIIDYFGDGSAFDCRITYLRESPDQPLGTGGSLALLEDAGLRPTEPILVLNGDVITDAPLSDVLARHAKLRSDVTVCTTTYTHTIPFGVVEHAGPDTISQIVEKPTEAWTVNAGIYAISPSILHLVPRGVEFPMIDLVADALHCGANVAAFNLGTRWLDIGRPSELRRARGQELTDDH